MLNISQLALAKLAQLGEHQTAMAEDPGSIPTRGNFLMTFFCFPL